MSGATGSGSSGLVCTRRWGARGAHSDWSADCDRACFWEADGALVAAALVEVEARYPGDQAARYACTWRDALSDPTSTRSDEDRARRGCSGVAPMPVMTNKPTPPSHTLFLPTPKSVNGFRNPGIWNPPFPLPASSDPDAVSGLSAAALTCKRAVCGIGRVKGRDGRPRSADARTLSTFRLHLQATTAMALLTLDTIFTAGSTF